MGEIGFGGLGVIMGTVTDSTARSSEGKFADIELVSGSISELSSFIYNLIVMSFHNPI